MGRRKRVFRRKRLRKRRRIRLVDESSGGSDEDFFVGHDEFGDSCEESGSSVSGELSEKSASADKEQEVVQLKRRKDFLGQRESCLEPMNSSVLDDEVVDDCVLEEVQSKPRNCGDEGYKKGDEEKEEEEEEEDDDDEEDWNAIQAKPRRSFTHQRNFGVKQSSSLDEKEVEDGNEDDTDSQLKPIKNFSGCRKPTVEQCGSAYTISEEEEDDDDDDEEFVPDADDYDEEEYRATKKFGKQSRTVQDKRRQNVKGKLKKTAQSQRQDGPVRMSSRSSDADFGCRNFTTCLISSSLSDLLQVDGNWKVKWNHLGRKRSVKQSCNFLEDENKSSGRRKKRYIVTSDSEESSDHALSERGFIRESACGDFSTLSSLNRLQIYASWSCLRQKRSIRKWKGKVDRSQCQLRKQVCGICLSEECDGIVRGILDSCMHYFCFTCIMEWSKVESRCPVCKRRFTTISKPARWEMGFGLRKEIISIPERDQVYQPSEEDIRSYFDPYENTVCIECQQGGDDDLMLLCDICDSAAHTYCIGLGTEVPPTNWYCDSCLSGSTDLETSTPSTVNQGGARTWRNFYLLGLQSLRF